MSISLSSTGIWITRMTPTFKWNSSAKGCQLNNLLTSIGRLCRLLQNIDICNFSQVFMPWNLDWCNPVWPQKHIDYTYLCNSWHGLHPDTTLYVISYPVSYSSLPHHLKAIGPTLITYLWKVIDESADHHDIKSLAYVTIGKLVAKVTSLVFDKVDIVSMLFSRLEVCRNLIKCILFSSICRLLSRTSTTKSGNSTLVVVRGPFNNLMASGNKQ